MALDLGRRWGLGVGLVLSLPASLALDLQWLEETGGEAYNVSGVWTLPASTLAAGEARLVFDYTDDQHYYCVRLAQERATFLRVQGGVTEEIGVSGTLLRLQPPESLRFTLQRRPWQKVFLCNGLRTAWAEDSSLPPGRIGLSRSGEVPPPSDLTVQPVGDVEFADDFMRTDTAGGWTPLRGKWTINAQGINVERSANAFSYRADTPTTALAVAGHPFWNDYRYEAAVRCDSQGAVGLVFHFQDEQNYHLFRWSSGSHPDGGQIQLWRIFQGQPTELARRPGGLEPYTWYRLRVIASGGRILTWIDDAPVFDLAEPFLGQGLIGLYAEKTLAAPAARDRGALFDDVELRPWPLFREDFSQAVPGRWQTLSGAWRMGAGLTGVEPAPPEPAGPALLVTSFKGWRDYTFAADVEATQGAVGLVCGLRDAGHYLLFRWTGPGPAGRAQWVQVQAGQETVLAEAAGGYAPGGQRLQITAEDGYWSATVAGQRVLDVATPTALEGGLGFYAAGARGVRFDNVEVSPPPATFPPAPVVPSIFQQDPYMTAWANPRGEWVPDRQGTQWHKGFFFGDQRVAWSLAGTSLKVPLTVALGCPEGDLNSGYALTLEPATSEGRLQLTLRHQGTGLATVEVPTDAGEFIFERRGSLLLVTVDGKKVLVQRLP